MISNELLFDIINYDKRQSVKFHSFKIALFTDLMYVKG